MRTRNVWQTILFRYRQFGGMQVIRIYAKCGALWPMLITFLKNPFSRQSYRKAYSVALRKIEPILCTKYASLLSERKAYYSEQSLEHKRSNTIWFCWLQGLEQAPDVIKVCYNSILRNLPNYELILIDNENWKEYVELPKYIIEKWVKEIIPPANFTDLLRLQLLIHYGGSWIDSTVLCTGITPQNEEYTRPYLNADLFVFQYTQPGSNLYSGISNWFITSCTNNEMLMVLRDMLYAYWKDYNCLIDYYIFHLFFSMLKDVYSDEMAAMPYGYSVNSLALGRHLGDKFDKNKWDRFTSKVCFHKLLYNLSKTTLKDENNYYNYILSEFGHLKLKHNIICG